MVIKLVLVRHGESLWNQQNLFTGWTDVDLSEKGKEEAKSAGQDLKDGGYTFDIIFTSVLKRAIKTTWAIQDALDLCHLPLLLDYRLNERHYGALQGLNKAETAEKYGIDQVNLWRRSFDIPPPALEETDKRHPCNDARYSKVDKKLLPPTESLKEVIDRFMPMWSEDIVPLLKKGKKILIAAHGNTLRALVKYLDNISNEEITGLNIPTGVPLVYELDDDLKAIKHYYLGDPEAVAAATAAVANQTQKK